MTATPAAVDHHQPTCDALARSTPLLAEAMRRAPGDVRPRKMRWTNGEIAAHMLASVIESEKSLRGEPSVYDTGISAESDERMVASIQERDPAVIADEIEQRTVALVSLARTLPGERDVTMPRGTVGVGVALLALDHHLHGGQFCETAGTTWQGAVADLHGPLATTVPYAFDPDAARGFTGSFTLALKGVAPVPYDVRDGELVMDVPGPTDVTLTSDVQTFLRVGIGVVSQTRAALTFKVRPSGRKPWLAFKVDRLFPAIPHGGVA